MDTGDPSPHGKTLARWRESGRPVQLLSRLAHVASTDAHNAAMLERLVSREPSIRARTLERLGTGTYGEPLAAFPSVGAAVKACGQTPVRDVVLAVGLEDLASLCLARQGLDGRAFVRHSVAVAAASRWQAERAGADADTAYVAGLLHDVGIPILALLNPELYTGARGVLAGSSTPLHAFESHALGYDHTVVAAAALREAGFPDPLVSAVARHHECGGPALDAIVQATDIVVLQVGGDVGFGIVPPELPAEVSRAAKLQDSDFGALAELVATSLARVDRALA